uniref:Uncharacterized protein n=1 Tax=Astyanax mexicanus TaxID=7994 RepID=A0A8B9H6I8_ASTMX
MADNVLDSGPPSAKRPKLSSPALSVSASDGNGKNKTFLNHFSLYIFSSSQARLHSSVADCSFPAKLFLDLNWLPLISLLYFPAHLSELIPLHTLLNAYPRLT